MNHKLILALLGATSCAVKLNMMQQAVGLSEADALDDADQAEGVEVTEISATVEEQPIAVPISIDLIEEEIVGGIVRLHCDDGSHFECQSGTRDCFEGSPFYCDAP